MTRKTITISHPLEDMLDIEPETTLIETIDRKSESVITNDYDNKDEEIDDQFQEIYDAAMSAFDMQSREVEHVEGQYKARNGEIAAHYLNTALAAAKEKASVKKHKDKITVSNKKASTPNTVNQNVIVSDRNDLLKEILGDK